MLDRDLNQFLWNTLNKSSNILLYFSFLILFHFNISDALSLIVLETNRVRDKIVGNRISRYSRKMVQIFLTFTVSYRESRLSPHHYLLLTSKNNSSVGRGSASSVTQRRFVRKDPARWLEKRHLGNALSSPRRLTSRFPSCSIGESETREWTINGDTVTWLTFDLRTGDYQGNTWKCQSPILAKFGINVVFDKIFDMFFFYWRWWKGWKRPSKLEEHIFGRIFRKLLKIQFSQFSCKLRKLNCLNNIFKIYIFYHFFLMVFPSKCQYISFYWMFVYIQTQIVDLFHWSIVRIDRQRELQLGFRHHKRPVFLFLKNCDFILKL